MGLAYHKSKAHKEGSKHKCKTCAVVFNRACLLVAHQKSAHSIPTNENKPYQCEACDSSFERADRLKRHRELEHRTREEWPNRCAQCDRGFPGVKSLRKHIETCHKVLANPVMTKQCDVTTSATSVTSVSTLASSLMPFNGSTATRASTAAVATLQKPRTPREMFQHSVEAIDLLTLLSQSQSNTKQPRIAQTTVSSSVSTPVQNTSSCYATHQTTPVLPQRVTNDSYSGRIEGALEYSNSVAAAPAAIRSSRPSLNDITEIVARHYSNENHAHVPIEQVGSISATLPQHSNVLEQAMQLANLGSEIIIASSRNSQERVPVQAESHQSNDKMHPTTTIFANSDAEQSGFRSASESSRHWPTASAKLLSVIEQMKLHSTSDSSISMQNVVFASSSQDVAGYYEIPHEQSPRKSNLSSNVSHVHSSPMSSSQTSPQKDAAPSNPIISQTVAVSSIDFSQPRFIVIQGGLPIVVNGQQS